MGSDVQRLGIVVDADDDPDAHWQSVTNKLQAAGYNNLSPEPVVGGLVHEQPDKRIAVGLWLMPDNQHKGMLEDFAYHLLPAGDSLWPRAVDAVTQVTEFEQRFKRTYLRKAQLHTWLAWQEEPGTPMGLAVTRQYLNVEAQPAKAFLEWLKRLFNLP